MEQRQKVSSVDFKMAIKTIEDIEEGLKELRMKFEEMWKKQTFLEAINLLPVLLQAADYSRLLFKNLSNIKLEKSTHDEN